MRVTKDGISVHAIPGTHTVLFGMDATDAARAGLLGFALGKRRPGGRIDWMNGFKVFEETAPNPAPGTLKPTNEHPIQDFQWSDYDATPATATDYVIRPLYGTPSDLRPGTDIELQVATLNHASARHKIHFNRGVVPGQAFARRFGNTYPTPDEQKDITNPKVTWLSRGLVEAALDFVGRARGEAFELRVAAYEFTYFPFLAALRDAAISGAKVRISVKTGDRRANGDIYQDETSLANWAAMLDPDLKLPSMARKGLTLHPRTWWAGIPHNKFMVLLENGHPVAVWTGSTNFTPSGFLGQANLAHEIEDEGLAERYNRYWEELAKDPPPAEFRMINAALTPDPAPLVDHAITAVFSPRPEGMLGWYAGQMASAEEAGFLTAAFGVAPEIGAAFTGPSNTLRMIVAENSGRSDAAHRVMAAIEADPDNIVAMGALLPLKSVAAGLEGEALDRWFLREELHRKTAHIYYIHTKLMMIDPFGAVPRAFSGSANFSSASVTNNDENMLLLSGDRAAEVMPILVNEFMRLHRHLYFRTVALRLAGRAGGTAAKAALLDPGDNWQRDHFTPGREKFRKRLLFR